MKWVTETSENRKLLKSYFNVEYPPIFIRKGEENVEVWTLYPPPQLHTGILGPANDVFKNIEKVVDISDFKKKYSIKGKGLGGDLQGPTLKGVMKDETKLKELEDIISQNDENMVLYTEHLRNLHKLNEVANSKNLDIDYAKYVINKLKDTYLK